VSIHRARSLTLSVAAVSLAAVLLAAASVRADDPRAASVRLKDLDGRAVAPLEATDARAVVFIFIRTDCPISNRYAPEVRRLFEKFARLGVKFWLVYPDPDESSRVVRKHVKQYGYRASALRDPEHLLVKVTGAEVTPEAVVFAAGKNVYRGRIDDRYIDFGKMRRAPTTHDLEEVLEAILEGRTIATKAAPAIGCFISDLR
jgi:hypothetical protein